MVQVPEYRYYIADLVTGSVISEIPFQGVSWERKISTAGQFSGNISADPNRDTYYLYESTLPGKNALYVMRNGVCVWGGIIWSREYSITDRVLSVTALEFISYFHHRVIWKSFTTDLYQSTGNNSTDADTIKTLLELFVNAMNSDFNESTISGSATISDPYAYKASDTYYRISQYKKTGTTTSSAVLITSRSHDLSVGNSIVIGNIPVSEFNGTFTITSVPSTTELRYALPSGGSAVTSTATVSFTSATYVTLQSNKNLLESAANVRITTDIDDSLNGYDGDTRYKTDALGDTTSNPFTFRGADVKYIGDILENFAKNGVPLVLGTSQTRVTARFDYYVECSYNGRTGKFDNVFKAWLVRKDSRQVLSDSSAATGYESLYGPSKLAASNLIFEHPGNISSLSLTEDADGSATRSWFVDSGSDMGESAENYYGGYTNLSYLNAGWPILESTITDQNLYVTSDEAVIPYAKTFSYKLAPPIGKFSFTVNGSLDPQIGTYKPGDWCVIIPNDSFINNRLKPPYENRSGVLVRKIVSISVSVPDTPAFPEQVTLEVVPEWEVS